jgi:general secretion pathway protein H
LARGNEHPDLRRRGFTLIELLVVVAIIAIASGVVALALRDGDASRLDEEAERLAALLEGARAEARAAGLAARWELRTGGDDDGFRFVGLPAARTFPSHWLHPGVSAEITGARAVVLGPEPLIGAQRIVLRLERRSLTLATDGLAPFAVADTAAAP